MHRKDTQPMLVNDHQDCITLLWGISIIPYQHFFALLELCYRQEVELIVGFSREGCLRGGVNWRTLRIPAGKIGEP